ncbi:hypothetical protein ACFY8O_29270 [Streptomyces argenteolus]|uniref:YD repeat-containing protein n=1 Tax=Streptomyces argenteolus TaxID=67274 RepID=A0ABW6XE37_9ACTN
MTRTEYDAVENVTWSTDAEQRATTYRHDKLDQRLDDRVPADPRARVPLPSPPHRT